MCSVADRGRLLLLWLLLLLMLPACSLRVSMGACVSKVVSVLQYYNDALKNLEMNDAFEKPEVCLYIQFSIFDASFLLQ